MHRISCFSDTGVAPANVIKVDFRVVPQPTLVRPAAVVVLYAVGIEALDLAVVFCDDKLNQDFPLGRQQQALQLFGVLKLLQGLHMAAK